MDLPGQISSACYRWEVITQGRGPLFNADEGSKPQVLLKSQSSALREGQRPCPDAGRELLSSIEEPWTQKLLQA